MSQQKSMANQILEADKTKAKLRFYLADDALEVVKDFIIANSIERFQAYLYRAVNERMFLDGFERHFFKGDYSSPYMRCNFAQGPKAVTLVVDAEFHDKLLKACGVSKAGFDYEQVHDVVSAYVVKALAEWALLPDGMAPD